jgi:hypothetical protein
LCPPYPPLEGAPAACAEATTSSCAGSVRRLMAPALAAAAPAVPPMATTGPTAVLLSPRKRSPCRGLTSSTPSVPASDPFACDAPVNPPPFEAPPFDGGRDCSAGFPPSWPRRKNTAAMTPRTSTAAPTAAPASSAALSCAGEGAASAGVRGLLPFTTLTLTLCVGLARRLVELDDALLDAV